MTSKGFCWPCPPCPPLRRGSPETPPWRMGQKENEDKQNRMKGPWRRSEQREETEEPKDKDSTIDSAKVPLRKNKMYGPWRPAPIEVAEAPEEKEAAIDSTNVPSGKNNRARCENVKDGQIVWLPKMDQIKSDSLILKHEKHEATYNHPALVVRVGQKIAEIRPITSLNGQSLWEKYGNNEMQHDVHVFIQDSRNKSGRFDNPNGSPSLNIAGGLDLVSPSYVRAEKRCWIEVDQLWEYSDVPMHLDEGSIKRVQQRLCDRIYEAESEAHREARKMARADLDLARVDRRSKSCPGTGQTKPNGPTTAFTFLRKAVKSWQSAPAVLETAKPTEEKEAAEKPAEVMEETKTDKAVEAPAETEGSSEPLAAEEAAEPADTEENSDQLSPLCSDLGASERRRVSRLRRVKSRSPAEFLMSKICLPGRHASI